VAVTANELARELRELIAALDRRIPRVEQPGEVAIARDAAALRAEALALLGELGDQKTSKQTPAPKGPTPSSKGPR
jgi:hypothetical protein